MKLADLAGQQFGRLTAVSRSEDHVTRRGNRKVQWLCRCVCGKDAVVIASALSSGNTRSCGCLRREEMAKTSAVVNGKALVSYNTAHRRVAATRGPASLHQCVVCRTRAEQWAYDYSDPDELVQETTVNGVVLHRLRYSSDPTRYDPKCRSCNAKDKQTQRETKD